MAKSLPKASSGTNPVDDGGGAFKTPAGVWVIVGMAVLFVLGQDLFDTADLEKNRVVEVWAVQP
jgi:hypothetical protein